MQHDQHEADGRDPRDRLSLEQHVDAEKEAEAVEVTSNRSTAPRS